MIHKNIPMAKFKYIVIFCALVMTGCHTTSPRCGDKIIVSDSISDKIREYYEVTRNDTSALSCIVDELSNAHVMVKVISTKSGKIMHRSSSNGYYEYSSDIDNIDVIHRCIEAFPPHYKIGNISQIRIHILIFPEVAIDVTDKLDLDWRANSLRDYDRVVDTIKQTALYSKVEQMLLLSGMQIESFSIGDMITYVDLSSVEKYKNSRESSKNPSEIIDCDLVFSVKPKNKNWKN